MVSSSAPGRPLSGSISSKVQATCGSSAEWPSSASDRAASTLPYRVARDRTVVPTSGDWRRPPRLQGLARRRQCNPGEQSGADGKDLWGRNSAPLGLRAGCDVLSRLEHGQLAPGQGFRWLLLAFEPSVDSVRRYVDNSRTYRAYFADISTCLVRAVVLRIAQSVSRGRRHVERGSGD